MKFSQFFQDDKGILSSSRLFSFMVVFATMIDWMNAVFTIGVWKPEYSTIGLILGVLGVKLAQKSIETKEKPKIEQNGISQ
jgi:hypothetical protein